MNDFDRELKYDAIAAGVLTVVAGLVLVLWNPQWGSHSDSGESDFDQDSGQFRVIGGQMASDGGPDIAESVADQAGHASASPRVALSDRTAKPLKSVDSPERLLHDDVDGLPSAKNSGGTMTGIRRRLLLEAAERALHSKTPWSDVSLVAMAFKRSGDEEAALYWFQRASLLAQDPDDLSEASGAMREVIKLLVSAKYFETAKELIGCIPMSSEKAKAKVELVAAYARIKEFAEARRLALTLRDSKTKGLAYRSIAEAEARYFELPVVQKTLLLILDQGAKDEAYSRVASVLAGKGDSNGAMMLVNRIQEVRLRDAAIARLAGISSKGSSFSFESLTALIRDPFLRDQALISMIEGEGDRRQIKVAARNVNRISSPQEKGKAHEALVSLQIRHGDLDGALDRAQSIDSDNSRNRALQAVAIAEVRKEGVGAARKTVHLIGDLDRRETAYLKVAQQAAVSGQGKGALETIHFMDAPSERAMAYASIALAKARYGDDGEARQLAQNANREIARVSSERDQGQATGVVAEVFAKIGDSGFALDSAASISNAGLRDVTYQRLAVSFANDQEPELAEQSANLIERETTREKALDSVALTLAKRVPFTEALDYVSHLDGYRQQVRFLLGVAGRKS